MKKEVILSIILILMLIPLLSAATPYSITLPWRYNFASDGILYESGSPDESSSPYFWLNSGAKLIIKGGRGMTIQGDLPTNDYWRKLYSSSNPLDTDNGYHPQNIFRLTSRTKWQNIGQSVYFKIIQDQLSSSPNREEYNGLLLMSRYNQDGSTLYYAGLRVDGYAVIKKKINGQYSTLAYVKIFPGVYNRSTNPNLLPKNTWLGLRSETKTNPDGSVTLSLYLDKNWNGVWTLIAQTTDKANPITNQGYTGIRTDFMDVVFDNYDLRNI